MRRRRSELCGRGLRGSGEFCWYCRMYSVNHEADEDRKRAGAATESSPERTNKNGALAGSRSSSSMRRKLRI